jgi:hypothetical protein
MGPQDGVMTIEAINQLLDAMAKSTLSSARGPASSHSEELI